MNIQRLTEQECYSMLTSSGCGRLACARDNQPYVVPIYFVVGDRCVYSFALPGQKVHWMRDNPKVCLEVDSIGARNDWTSVVVNGRYHELSDTPKFERERALAQRLLQQRAMWWEPGAVSLDGHVGGYVPIVYRISLDSMSGLRGVPVTPDISASVSG